MFPAAVALVGSGASVAFLALVAIAVAAGFVGALLGLGGGLFVVPALYLLFGVDIRLAIAASLVAVIATSCGSAAAYVESGLSDVRLGMFLEMATTFGGLVGALVAVTILARAEAVLAIAFVPVVLLSAYLMVRYRSQDTRPDVPPDALADRFRLHGHFVDDRTGLTVHYRVTAVKTGLAFSVAAGFASGLLGIGGGTFKVPAMASFMNVPMRVATATSNFMIGVTASAGAIVYLLAGDVALILAAPVVLGVFVGSLFGARWSATASPPLVKILFAAVLGLAAVLMVLRATGVLL